MSGSDTIFALSSGAGRAGVAVIRLSGPGVPDVLRRLAGSPPEPRVAALRTLRDSSGEPLDRALVLYFPAPASFTGEEVSELHVHGGTAVISGVLDVLGSLPGLRAAEAGEFARRAFENGKLDLTEVEGLADLIEAETQAQRRQALRQSGGALGVLYENWRSDIIESLALVEASLDFSDEADVPEAVASGAVAKVMALREAIAAHLDDANTGERLRAGFTVALTGAPNAGKSSLLNALAARDVAIVSEEAGTTRDVLEVHLDLGGLPVTVLDTAGLREAAGSIEAEGVRRALARAGSADLVIWVVDAQAPEWTPPPELTGDGRETLHVLNKIDRAPPAPAGPVLPTVVEISVTTGQGLDSLTRTIGDRLRAGMGDLDAPMITRARHRAELQRARDALAAFLSGELTELELRAEDLRIAAHALGRITGRVDVEDILDRIFAGFCIGK